MTAEEIRRARNELVEAASLLDTARSYASKRSRHAVGWIEDAQRALRRVCDRLDEYQWEAFDA